MIVSAIIPIRYYLVGFVVEVLAEVCVLRLIVLGSWIPGDSYWQWMLVMRSCPRAREPWQEFSDGGNRFLSIIINRRFLPVWPLCLYAQHKNCCLAAVCTGSPHLKMGDHQLEGRCKQALPLAQVSTLLVWNANWLGTAALALE